MNGDNGTQNAVLKGDKSLNLRPLTTENKIAENQPKTVVKTK